MVSARVSAGDTVKVLFLNKTGGLADLPAGTLKAVVHRP